MNRKMNGRRKHATLTYYGGTYGICRSPPSRRADRAPRVLADVAVSREHASAMDTSNDDAIATFIAFTGADNQMAAQFLQMANNDVEMAASLFFAAAEGGPAPGEVDEGGHPRIHPSSPHPTPGRTRMHRISHRA